MHLTICPCDFAGDIGFMASSLGFMSRRESSLPISSSSVPRRQGSFESLRLNMSAAQPWRPTGLPDSFREGNLQPESVGSSMRDSQAEISDYHL